MTPGVTSNFLLVNLVENPCGNLEGRISPSAFPPFSDPRETHLLLLLWFKTVRDECRRGSSCCNGPEQTQKLENSPLMASQERAGGTFNVAIPCLILAKGSKELRKKDVPLCSKNKSRNMSWCPRSSAAWFLRPPHRINGLFVCCFPQTGRWMCSSITNCSRPSRCGPRSGS